MCAKIGKYSIVAKISNPLLAYFKGWVFLQLFAPLNHTKRGGSFSSCVQRWPAAEQFLLTETATLFIENKCWHLEAAAVAAVGKRKGEVVSGGWGSGGEAVRFGECLWCYLTTVQSPWGSPPENKACLSITQLLMKAIGLKKKKKVARGWCGWFS